MTLRPLVWVGIDVGKSAHHACAIDAEGRVVFSQKLANDQAAIEALVARAGQAASEVRWAIDLTNSAAALLVACWWPPKRRSSTCPAGWSTG